VAVSSCCGDRVLVGGPATISGRDKFVQLEPINSYHQLALIPLHCGHRHSHVVDDSTNVGQLFLSGLGFGWWSRHGSRGGGRGWNTGLRTMEVECAALVEEKNGSEYHDVVARGIRANEQVTPSQLGQD
jgi:hypothetical protein